MSKNIWILNEEKIVIKSIKRLVFIYTVFKNDNNNCAFIIILKDKNNITILFSYSNTVI